MIVSPEYNLDVAGAARLEDRLLSAEGDVTIDLSAVDFVASSGLRVMLKVAQRLGALTVTGANDTVREVFRISGFATVVAVED